MEKVQNRMTRLLREGTVMTPEERNMRMGLTTHEVRRKRGDLIHMYKYINEDKLFNLTNNTISRRNDKNVAIPLFISDPKRHSFAYRSIHHWNDLSNDIVNAQSLNIFKSKIDNILS